MPEATLTPPDTSLIVWTEAEQAIAHQAFDRAYGRAVDTVIHTVRHQAGSITTVDALWRLHDYLSTQRHGMEGRFDFRLDGILFVFASLVKDDLLQFEELSGLDDDKLTKIRAMSRF